LFRSTPFWKWTVSVYVPSLVHCEDMLEHVLDAVDLLFDRRGHRIGDHLGVGPGIGPRTPPPSAA